MSKPDCDPAMKKLPSAETARIFGADAISTLPAETPLGAGNVIVPVPFAVTEYVTPALVCCVAAPFRLTAVPLTVTLPKLPLPFEVALKYASRDARNEPPRKSRLTTLYVPLSVALLALVACGTPTSRSTKNDSVALA